MRRVVRKEAGQDGVQEAAANQSMPAPYRSFCVAVSDQHS